MLRKHSHTLSRLTFAAEVFFIFVSWLLALKFSHTSYVSVPLFNILTFSNLPAAFALLLFWGILFHISKLYSASRRSRTATNLILAKLKVHSITFVCFFIFVYFIDVNLFYTRKTFTLFYIISSLSIILLTYFWVLPLNIIRRKGFNTKKLLIVGAGNLGLNILNRIHEDPWMGYNVVGFLDDKINIGEKGVIGTISDYSSVVHKHNIDTVIIALPLRAYKKVEYVMEQSKSKLTDLYLCPDVFQFQLLNCGITDLGGLPIIDMISSPINGIQGLLKRFIDIIFSLLSLVILSPLLGIIAIAIKRNSEGPIFYKQLRTGFNGKNFLMYKFRSMYVHDPKISETRQATKGDPRITNIGSFLRRTSMDELPQLINVLLGQMSLVGPRPHAVKHNEHYDKLIPAYLLRHKVKPGITGWAQANGWRGETEKLYKMEQRVEHDRYYIEHWNLWLDLKILFLTIFKGFKGAY